MRFIDREEVSRRLTYNVCIPIVRSRYIADSRVSVLAARAEFLHAKAAGLINDTHIVAEIGEVLSGRVEGCRTPSEITLYKSLGHIVQDLATAYACAPFIAAPSR